MSNKSSTIAIIMTTIAVTITVISIAACNSYSGELYILVTTSSVASSVDESIPEDAFLATTTATVTAAPVTSDTATLVTTSEVSETTSSTVAHSPVVPTETTAAASATTTAATQAPKTTTSATTAECSHEWRLWTEWEDRDEYKCSLCGATMYKDKPQPTYTIPSPTPSPTPEPTKPVETTAERYITGVDVAIQFWYCIDWEQAIDEERVYVVHNVDPNINWPASDTNAKKALVAEYGLDPEMFFGIGGKSVIGAYLSDGGYYSYR